MLANGSIIIHECPIMPHSFGAAVLIELICNQLAPHCVWVGDQTRNLKIYILRNIVSLFLIDHLKMCI